jgi:hypothetical protein
MGFNSAFKGLTSWNPLDHSRPVTGLLYFYLYLQCKNIPFRALSMVYMHSIGSHVLCIVVFVVMLVFRASVRSRPQTTVFPRCAELDEWGGGGAPDLWPKLNSISSLSVTYLMSPGKSITLPGPGYFQVAGTWVFACAVGPTSDVRFSIK